jgi:hypothetical protein
MFFPSTYPSSCNPSRNASIRAATAEGVVFDTNPIRGILAGCCASAETKVISKTVISTQTRYFERMIFAPAFYRSLITDNW